LIPRVHRSRVTHDRWLVSYADFITLLFAFFVVMYAFVSADRQKPAQVSAAIDSAFQSMAVYKSAPQTMVPVENPSTITAVTVRFNPQSANVVRDDLQRIQLELEQAFSSQIDDHSIAIHMGEDGLVISLREAGFFNSGSATPRPDSVATLRKIALMLGRTPYEVRVEGHTDNVPVHNAEFDSNWELSSARATRIARFFLEMHAIAPERLSASGYAEFHPIADNSTSQGRAQNRRVDLVVRPRSAIDLRTHPDTSGGPWRRITDE